MSNKRIEQFGEVDQYLQSISQEAREALESLRKSIRLVIPDAVEVISYRIPIFKHQGKGLVGMSAAKNHCSFHLMSTTVMERHKDDLKDFETTKATIHFTNRKPIPPPLVKKLVQSRLDEVEARTTKRA